MRSDDIADPTVSARDTNPSLENESQDDRAARPRFPGEHLLVLGLGAWLLMAGMRGGTVMKRAAFTAAGTALIGRAASGSGGLARVARALKKIS